MHPTPPPKKTSIVNTVLNNKKPSGNISSSSLNLTIVLQSYHDKNNLIFVKKNRHINQRNWIEDIT